MKPKKFVRVGTETLEVYVTQLGQVAVKQSRMDAKHFVFVSPGNIPELISYLTAAGQEAQALIQPSVLPGCEHSSVKVCEHSHGKSFKPIYHALVHGCGVALSPDGGLEIQLGCTPKHLPQPEGEMIGWTHDVVVKFHESLFREVSLDGLRLLDHKPPATRN